MRKNAKEVQEMVEQMREQKRDMLRGQYGLDGDSGDDDITPVSSL
jgi:hypothetical protein